MAKSEAIVILTGAGISQESGLETFRDEGGLWSRTRITKGEEGLLLRHLPRASRHRHDSGQESHNLSAHVNLRRRAGKGGGRVDLFA